MCSTVAEAAAALEAARIDDGDPSAGWAGAGRSITAEAKVVELARAAEQVRRAMLQQLGVVAAECGLPAAVELLVRSGWAFGRARPEVDLAVGLHGPAGAAATAKAVANGT